LARGVVKVALGRITLSGRRLRAEPRVPVRRCCAPSGSLDSPGRKDASRDV